MNPISELGRCNGGQSRRRLDGRNVKATFYQWLGRNTCTSTDFDRRVSKAESGRLG
jgi:hypothetical protein